MHGDFTGTDRQEIVTGQPNRGLWRYQVSIVGEEIAEGGAGFLGVVMMAAETENPPTESGELPAEIIVLPADRYGPEWRFNLATGIYSDRDGGPFEGGYTEDDFREASVERSGSEPSACQSTRSTTTMISLSDA